MKKSILALSSVLLFAVTGLLAGETTLISLKGNDPNFNKVFRGGVNAKFKSITADGLVVKGNGPIYTSAIEKNIDPNASYELTIKIKYNGNRSGISFGGGFMTNVGSSHVFCQPETLTELAADFTKGDNEIIVKDASKWKTGRFMVAFDAKEDASDLPNRKLTKVGITTITITIWFATKVSLMTSRKSPASTTCFCVLHGRTSNQRKVNLIGNLSMNKSKNGLHIMLKYRYQ